MEVQEAWNKIPSSMARLHIGINAQTLQMRSICITSNNLPDAAVLPQLLAQRTAGEP